MAHPKRLSAKEVAEFFVWRAQEEGKPVTNKKLQKLIYYAQAWSLALNKEKLFDDKIEAWIHGPAVRDVYLEYKKFGFNPITKKVSVSSIKSLQKNQREHLENVWKTYGGFDAQYLEYLTHSEDPWQKAREGTQPHEGSDKEISTESMMKFYSSKLKQTDASRGK